MSTEARMNANEKTWETRVTCASSTLGLLNGRSKKPVDGEALAGAKAKNMRQNHAFLKWAVRRGHLKGTYLPKNTLLTGRRRSATASDAQILSFVDAIPNDDAGTRPDQRPFGELQRGEPLFSTLGRVTTEWDLAKDDAMEPKIHYGFRHR